LSAQQAAEVLGGYRPTAKNHKVKDFYPRYGFAAVSGDGGPDATVLAFRHDLSTIVPTPGHISLTENFD